MGDVSVWLATAENRADIRHLLYVSFAADAPRDFGRRIAAPIAADDAVIRWTPVPGVERAYYSTSRLFSEAVRDCTAAHLAGMRAPGLHWHVARLPYERASLPPDPHYVIHG